MDNIPYLLNRDRSMAADVLLRDRLPYNYEEARRLDFGRMMLLAIRCMSYG